MKKILILLLFSFLFLLKPQASLAETIHSFQTSILAHKNGVMDITKTINYDFEGLFRHGIYRHIPNYATVGNLYRIYKISNIQILRDGTREDFTRSGDANQTYIKIGNADKTITGAHTYTISYNVSNGIGSNYSDHDEIYWNITGNGWEVPIEEARATVSTDFSVTPTKLICYTGALNSKDQNCTVNVSLAEAKNLYSGEGLTIVATYPVNSFPKSILSSSPPQTLTEKIFSFIIANYLYIWIFLNIFVVTLLVYWYEKHKNKKRFGKPAVNFDIPKDEKGNILRPALAGTVDTSKLVKDDVTATIFDLAIRKYIKLEEKKTVRSLLPDSTTQTITKLKEGDAKLETFEKELFDFIFETGDSVDIKDLKLTFYQEFQDMEKSVFASLVNKKCYTKNPKTQKAGIWLLAILSFSTLNFILGIVFLFLSQKLNGRTPQGDEIDFKIDGLKIFLKSMDRNYKWQAVRFYTVEQMIPYAIALGFIDKFMENLKVNYPDYKPYWYAGYTGSFYSNYSGLTSSITTTVAPPSSSGSGGGGFSGGGGGGGGGGSW